jgi:hypothetical protein
VPGSVRRSLVASDRRETKAVDAVVTFAKSAPPRWQATTALTQIETIADERYDLITDHLGIWGLGCDFRVEGNSSDWWSETREEAPETGEQVEHRRKTDTVIDLDGIVGGDLVLVTVRRQVDEPAMV